MPFDAECHNCSRTLRLRDELNGKKIRCPDCSAVIDLGSSSTSRPAPSGSASAGTSASPASDRSDQPSRSAKRSAAGNASNKRRTQQSSSQETRPPRRADATRRKPAQKTGPQQKPRRRPRAADFTDESEFEVLDDFDGYGDDFDEFGDDHADPLPRQTRRPRRKQKKSKKTQKSRFSSLLIAGGFVLLLTCTGVLLPLISTLTRLRQVAELGDVNGPMQFADVPLPVFPEPGPAVVTFPSGVTMHNVNLGMVNDAKAEPGFGMQLRIYRPPGARSARSAPCVLVAPAGTNLLVGNDLDGDDYHDETLAYAESGCVTIFYSIDGGVRDLSTAADSEVLQAYRAFLAARAGVVNGRNALEYALAKLPEVDPQQIFCAGHSSAGTLSLLLASHESRIAGCIAYAPVASVQNFLAPILADGRIKFLFPKLKEFSQHSSPDQHVARLTCPLMLFHAADDQTVPIAEVSRYAELVKHSNPRVEFLRVERGGHYEPMVRQGIPMAIERIRRWTGR